MIFIPGMHFRSLSALSFVQLWGKWILCSCSILMIHGVHLLTWAEASIYLSHVIKSCQGPGGGLSSWGTESRDMGHPVSYDHHTLGPTCGRLIGWSHQHGVLIGRWQPLRKGMEQTQTQGITRNTTNIVNSRQWRGMTRSSDDNAGHRHHVRWASGHGGIANSCKNCNHISRHKSSGVRRETDCTLLMRGEQIPR